MPLLLPALLSLAIPAATPLPDTGDTIHWRLTGSRSDGLRRPALSLSHGRGSHGTTPLAAAPPLARAVAANHAGPIRFAIARAAGRLDCSGVLAGGDGSGRCGFAPDPAFARGLAARGMRAPTRDQLIALTLADATLDRVDGLRAAGLPPRHGDDLIAAAALDISGPYLAGLTRAGLIVTRFDDLIALKALDVRADFVRGLVAAGYPRLAARDAIGMKAVGVTPAYARAMNAGRR